MFYKFFEPLKFLSLKWKLQKMGVTIKGLFNLQNLQKLLISKTVSEKKLDKE